MIMMNDYVSFWSSGEPTDSQTPMRTHSFSLEQPIGALAVSIAATLVNIVSAKLLERQSRRRKHGKLAERSARHQIQ